MCNGDFLAGSLCERVDRWHERKNLKCGVDSHSEGNFSLPADGLMMRSISKDPKNWGESFLESVFNGRSLEESQTF